MEQAKDYKRMKDALDIISYVFDILLVIAKDDEQFSAFADALTCQDEKAVIALVAAAREQLMVAKTPSGM